MCRGIIGFPKLRGLSVWKEGTQGVSIDVADESEKGKWARSAFHPQPVSGHLTG